MNSQDGAIGIQQATRILAFEVLIGYAKDAQPQPRLAESLSGSNDRLLWTIRLRPGVKFHNGVPVTADIVRDALRKQLPAVLGDAYDDVDEIRSESDLDVSVRLKRRSSLVVEALDVVIEAPGAGKTIVGTGPYAVAESPSGKGPLVMVANQSYHEGIPNIRQLVFESYPSARSAWADLLRNDVDMLFEVGADAIDSLRGASQTKVFTFDRPYALVVLLNTRRPVLAKADVRRALSSAVDRDAIVRDGLGNHGRPAINPVWPDHWANGPGATFEYRPVRVGGAGERPAFKLGFSDPSHERLALMLQRMLAAVDVNVTLESAPIDDTFKRLTGGDFDAWIVDALLAPSLFRSYRFWHSEGNYNWGHYNNAAVDGAMESMRRAATDDEYRDGVARFRSAMVDDPPAIFLAWTERARAVSTRFEVPVEQSRDILGTLSQWRPVGVRAAARAN